MSTKVQVPLVDDQQVLQGVDQAGFAGVVRGDERDGLIQGELCPFVPGTVEEHQLLETVI